MSKIYQQSKKSHAWLLSLKKVKMLLRTLSKSYTVLRKKLKYLKDPTNRSSEITSWLLGRRERRNACWACRCFLPKSRITAYTLQNYFNFKNKFLFNNGGILEINDYYNNRNRENVSYTELCEIINTLSN